MTSGTDDRDIEGGNAAANGDKNTGGGQARTSAEDAANALMAALSVQGQAEKHGKKHRMEQSEQPLKEQLPPEQPERGREIKKRPAEKEEQPKEEKIVLPPKLMAKKVLLEFVDMLKGAAFPFIVMCVFSTTIILFYGFEDFAVQLIAVIFGEGLMIAAFIMFGRQNGAAAYRKSKLNGAKRRLGNPDKSLLLKTGEYAPWKGFVIAFIATVPFIIFQTIKCFGDYSFVDFMLEYACGWAVAPLEVIGGIPQPYYLLMIALPIALMGGFYIQGSHAEEKRQKNIGRAEDDMRKGKKKHYYEENTYDSGVELPEDDRKGGR